MTLAPGVAPPAVGDRAHFFTNVVVRGLRQGEHRAAAGAVGRSPCAPTRRSSPAEVVAALPDALRAEQRSFDKTGGLHAAGLLPPDGELLVVREDVGRHNAVDKVVGWALQAARLPASGCVLSCRDARRSS